MNGQGTMGGGMGTILPVNGQGTAMSTPARERAGHGGGGGARHPAHEWAGHDRGAGVALPHDGARHKRGHGEPRRGQLIYAITGDTIRR